MILNQIQGQSIPILKNSVIKIVVSLKQNQTITMLLKSPYYLVILWKDEKIYFLQILSFLAGRSTRISICPAIMCRWRVGSKSFENTGEKIMSVYNIN